MKKFILILFFASPIFSFAQLGVSYHHSTYFPFAGINYEFADRIRPELRIGAFGVFQDDFSLELAVTYDILNKEYYEFYAGASILTRNYFTGILMPIGLNFYPFDSNNFGFHMELATIFGEYDPILRGTFGIRYQFGER